MTIQTNQTTVPAATRFINAGSEMFFNLCQYTVVPSALVGGVLGYWHSKPRTFTLCWGLQTIFWNYINPYTLDAIFQNKHSNSASRSMGTLLSIATSLAGSYFLTKFLTQQAAKSFPAQADKLNNEIKDFKLRHVVYLSIAPFFLRRHIF
jgi:hypothetical protein